MNRTSNTSPLMLAMVVLCAFVAGQAANAEEPMLVNGGFENLEPDGSVKGWRLDESSAAASVVEGVAKEFNSGVGSLQLSVRGHGSATVVSEAINLKVGRLYRLSGVIRTRGVVSDPTTKYPTAVPTCLTMASFPFTNHSPTVGADSDWTRVESLFIATTAEDRVRLHLGYNGAARGTAWFDDVRVEPVDDITEYIPLETVRWAGNGFRYDDKGWIFVHIEGEPYERGYQYGYLVADEISAYIEKLAVQQNSDDPVAGWDTILFETDNLFLRGYEQEYLTEMKGIADGAARAGAEFDERPLDLKDIVAINSVIDLGQLHRAASVTPHSLTGQGFLEAEEEMAIEDSEHKCSAFVATGPATRDGRVVFGQIFMWGGFTGVHWNVICDIEPSTGHRLVYHTFPGGIHSGADFYMNSAGIVIGETTVSQTPYEPDSTPQSNRIRKAAQYASSIDDVERILWDGNNGMYTNDWPIADVKTDEVAILLLGTHRKKLWRTSEDLSPFGTPGFLWANNNNRDVEVRKEYLAQPEDRPFDLMFTPWNRDVAFNEFFAKHNGQIDAIAGVNLWASSPINRAHACDGKITTSEMVEQLVFLAHHGKTTLREKFPQAGSRRMPDLPGAVPHLTLGYSVASPIFIAEKLKQAREQQALEPKERQEYELQLDSGDGFEIDSKRLWRQTVFPASDAEAWFVSGSASYWRMLRELEVDTDESIDDLEELEENVRALAAHLAELANRYLYVVSREDDLAAVDSHRAYDRYGPYQISRIKGTIALHQLRLALGTETFLKAMREVHDRFANREMTTRQFLDTVRESTQQSVDDIVLPWIERTGLPDLRPEFEVRENRQGSWLVEVSVSQGDPAYRLMTYVMVEVDGVAMLHPMELDGTEATIEFAVESRPDRVVFNALNDVPVQNDSFYTWANFIDDFHSTLIVFGTSQQDEANHTLARRWQQTVADAYVEILPPLVKDAELTKELAEDHDLMVLGSLADNSFLGSIATDLPVELGKNHFVWQDAVYADPDDGLFLVVPNPFNPQKVLYLVLANSAMQLHRMTSEYRRGLPSWALMHSDELIDSGVHIPQGFEYQPESEE
ncbi:MAG: hypothetical protein GY906_40760 [bacterium]|nr:hypothetical protein [bacterium]